MKRKEIEDMEIEKGRGVSTPLTAVTHVSASLVASPSEAPASTRAPSGAATSSSRVQLGAEPSAQHVASRGGSLLY